MSCIPYNLLKLFVFVLDQEPYQCRSLLEVELNYWLVNEDYGENEILEDNTNMLLTNLEEKEEEILEGTLSSESEEVAHYIQAIFLEGFIRLRFSKYVKQS